MELKAEAVLRQFDKLQDRQVAAVHEGGGRRGQREGGRNFTPRPGNMTCGAQRRGFTDKLFDLIDLPPQRHICKASN